MRKLTLMKGNQRTVMEYHTTPTGTVVDITNSYYLTAYKTYGAKSTMCVPLQTAEEIYNRLLRKGFELISR